MSAIRLRERWETLEGEHLKHAAETALHLAARTRLGSAALEGISGVNKLDDSKLFSVVAGIPFETPIGLAAGWSKDGKAVDGLHDLGFSHVEVGTVPELGQPGNPKPRLWFEDGVGFNRLGFNSPGSEVVAHNLAKLNLYGVLGINIGLNKDTPHSDAARSHAAVAERLARFADYMVINVASPNTPKLRELFGTKPLTDIIQSVQGAIVESGYAMPLFVKTTVDLSEADMVRIMGICAENDLAGIIDSNTTVNPALLAKYRRTGQMGGLSGDIPLFRQQLDERMKFITRESRGTGLARIGVGAINSAQAAIDRLESGAQVLQVLTAIRQRGPRVATGINRGILNYMYLAGVGNVEDLVGQAV